MNNENNKTDFYLHSIMCLIGGFLGAYAIINRFGNLGSAQTANLIYIILCFLGHNLKEFILHVFGMILYFVAIELYVYLTKKTKINIKRYCIYVIMSGSILLNFIPVTSDPVIGLLPIFFMMATQWSVFHGTNGYNSSTIFSTNNFRQTALAIGAYIIDKDESQKSKVCFFANSLLWYHIGVAISFFACRSLNIHASLLCLIPTFSSLLLTYKDEKVTAVSMDGKTIA